MSILLVLIIIYTMIGFGIAYMAKIKPVFTKEFFMFVFTWPKYVFNKIFKGK